MLYVHVYKYRNTPCGAAQVSALLIAVCNWDKTGKCLSEHGCGGSYVCRERGSGRGRECGRSPLTALLHCYTLFVSVFVFVTFIVISIPTDCPRLPSLTSRYVTLRHW